MPLPQVERDIPGDYQIQALLHGRGLQRAWHRCRLDLIATLLPPPSDALSLDLAAGSGILTWRFRPAPIVSVDMRVSACRAVRAHTAGAAAVAAELRRLPFASGSFSRVYCLETLEHLSVDEARDTLAEARRVLGPQGRCLITTPNYRSHWIALEWLIDRLQMTPPFAGGQHVTRYTGASLASLVESAGWRLLRAGSFNGIAPFAGVVGSTLGTWTVEAEASYGRRTGALLYIICAPVP